MYPAGTTSPPPVETDSMLLRVTVGCNHNKCSYCNMYKHLQFREVELAQIESQLQQARKFYDRVDRIFLVDGDALSLPTERLLEVSKMVNTYFPECTTITTYGSARSIRLKTDEELLKLRNASINDIYVGIESGSDDVLLKMQKGSTVSDSAKQLKRLTGSGIDHMALIMLGIGGEGKGLENGRATAAFLNETSPKLIWASTLGIFEGTQLQDSVEQGGFIPATEYEVLEEEKELIRNINLQNVPFYGTHITNTVPVSGLVTRDRDQMIETIDHCIDYYGAETLHKSFDRAALHSPVVQA